MPFEFRSLPITGLVLVERKSFEDARGFFEETFKESVFGVHGIPGAFPQDNHSYSRGGVLRGLHFQLPPRAQGKLVYVVTGEIVDVAVDLRDGSPWFARWHAVVLSEKNRRMLYLPPGFAHGFYVRSEAAHVVYKVTEEYAAALDAGVRWDDPDVGVQWPNPDPQLSDRDASLPWLRDVREKLAFQYVEESAT